MGKLASQVKLKRVYEAPDPSDGKRILVDRLWPRGLTKEKAAVDLWLKEIAPSNELRKSFGHDPEKWPAFQKAYIQELRQNPDAVERLKSELADGPVTIVYGARDQEHNEALVLRDFIK
jgi:uncharacterized protein YeaO (DUF488 family)